MTAKRFYRAGAALPFVAMIPGLIFGGPPGEGMDMSSADLFSLFTFVGALAAIPYLLYLGAVALFVKPQTESAHRRVTLLAPIIVSAEFVIGLTVFQQFIDQGSTFAPDWTVFLPGTVGVVFGYAYVIVIEGSLAIAKRAGWVQP